jgi:hypothetical protein
MGCTSGILRRLNQGVVTVVLGFLAFWAVEFVVSLAVLGVVMWRSRPGPADVVADVAGLAVTTRAAA